MGELYRNCYFRKTSILLTRSPGLLNEDEEIITNVHLIRVTEKSGGISRVLVVHKDDNIYHTRVCLVKGKLYYSKAATDYNIAIKKDRSDAYS